MDKDPNRNLPDDKCIEEMLSAFAPQPTVRLQAIMSSAPWQKQNSPGISNQLINQKPVRKLIWGLAGLGFILAILVIMFVPSVRAAANQIFHLFLESSSNQLNVQVTLTSPGDKVDFSDPDNFPLKIKEVQLAADFGVKEISELPSGLTFVGSRFDPSYNTVTLLYEADDYKLFLTQRPQVKGEDLFSIGTGAIVKNVKIGNIEAEFVVGGWKAISTQPSIETLQPGSSVNISAIWDNGYPQFTLRWQAEGIVYELRSDGEGSPSQSILINLANGLK